MAAVHGAHLCDERSGFGRLGCNKHLAQEQSVALLFTRVIRAGCGIRRWRGFVFLSASVVWWKLYRHCRHIGVESIVEPATAVGFLLADFCREQQRGRQRTGAVL